MRALKICGALLAIVPSLIAYIVVFAAALVKNGACQGWEDGSNQ